MRWRIEGFESNSRTRTAEGPLWWRWNCADSRGKPSELAGAGRSVQSVRAFSFKGGKRVVAPELRTLSPVSWFPCFFLLPPPHTLSSLSHIPVLSFISLFLPLPGLRQRTCGSCSFGEERREANERGRESEEAV